MRRKIKISKKSPFLFSFFFVAGSFLIPLFALLPFYKNTSIIPCANTKSCEQSFNFQTDNNTLGIFENSLIPVPQIDLVAAGQDNKVQGIATASGEKHIHVDLAKQKLYAYQGSTLYMEASISSGKWFPSPTGEFSIWHKVRATRMTGGSGSSYYDLPNVEYVMFFYNKEIVQSRGFAFHGAYWHNNFGHAMSHGCINMRNIDAKALYEWADPISTAKSVSATADNPGTKVTIYNTAP